MTTVNEDLVGYLARVEIAHRAARTPGRHVAVLDAYLLRQLYDSNPGISIDEAREKVEGTRNFILGKYTEGVTEESLILLGSIGAGFVGIEATIFGMLLGGAIEFTGSVLSATKPFSDTESREAFERSLGDQAREDKTIWALSELRAEAEPDGFGKAYREIIAKTYFDIDLDQPVEALLDQMPELRLSPALKPYLDSGVPHTLTDADIRALVKKEITAQTSRLTKELEQLKATETKNRLAKQSVPPTDAQLLERTARLHEIEGQYREFQAAISVAVGITALINDAGVRKVLQDGTRIANAVGSLANAVATHLIDPKRVSTLALTGNALGAIVVISQVFGPNSGDSFGPALQAISEQISVLRDDMNRQFGYMHTRLNQIMDMVAENYRLMVTLLKEVMLVRYELNEQAKSLSFISANVESMIQALAARQLTLQEQTCLKWRETYNFPISNEQYVLCQQFFFTSAVTWSRDALNSPEGGDTSNAQAAKGLSNPNSSLDRNIRYLARLAYTRFQVPCADAEYLSCPNPLAWLTAVRHYFGLASDWPELFVNQTNPINDLTDMIRVGKITAAVLNDLGGVDAPSRKKLLERVSQNYEESASAAVAAVEDFLTDSLVKMTNSLEPGSPNWAPDLTAALGFTSDGDPKERYTFSPPGDPFQTPLWWSGEGTPESLRRLTSLTGEALSLKYTDIRRNGPYYEIAGVYNPFAGLLTVGSDVVVSCVLLIGSLTIARVRITVPGVPKGNVGHMFFWYWKTGAGAGQDLLGYRASFFNQLFGIFGNPAFEDTVTSVLAWKLITKSAAERHKVQKCLLGSIDSTSVLDALQDLDGARLIAEGFLSAGVPDSFSRSLPLQLLFGGDPDFSLLNRQVIQNIVLFVVGNTPANEMVSTYENDLTLAGLFETSWQSAWAFEAPFVALHIPEFAPHLLMPPANALPRFKGWAVVLNKRLTEMRQALKQISDTPYALEVDKDVTRTLVRLELLRKDAEQQQH